MDFIFTCMGHSAAARRAFLVGKDEDFSRSQIRRETAFVLTRKARPVPTRPIVISGAAEFLGGNVFFSCRLRGFLRLDFEKICSGLRWFPLCSIDEVLKSTDQYFQEGKKL